MNTPNPLMPEGSLESKGKSNVRIAVFTILTIHVVLLGGLLMQGCKKSEPAPVVTEPTNAIPDLPPITEATNLPVAPIDTNPIPVPPVVNTSSPVPVPPIDNTPVPADPTVSAPAGEAKVHVVEKGESFSTIAQKYHVSVKAIEEANPGVDSTKLQLKQKLNIPAPATVAPTSATASSADSSIYVVKTGDALEKIAKNHNTTVKAIKALNNMRTDQIKAGQKLKMPAPTTK